MQDPPPPAPHFKTPQSFRTRLSPISDFGGKCWRRKKTLASCGGIFFFTLRVYTQNTQNFVEDSKMGEKHKKF